MKVKHKREWEKTDNIGSMPFGSCFRFAGNIAVYMTIRSTRMPIGKAAYVGLTDGIMHEIFYKGESGTVIPVEMDAVER